MNKIIEEITWKFSPPLEFPCMRCQTAYATHHVRLYLGPDKDLDPDTGYFQCACCWDCAQISGAALFDDMLRPKTGRGTLARIVGEI